ncbi:chemotaxis protein CheW [Methylomonas sp. MgM2]
MEAKLQTILIFELDGTRFGLDAKQVLESVRLPELTSIDEAPPWVIGMFNLRGRIVPVTDLCLRFGHAARSLSLDDQVIVLSKDDLTMGLLVGEVLDVIELSPDAIEPPPRFEQIRHGLDRLASGIASIADELVTLIDVSKLMKQSRLPAIDYKGRHKASNRPIYAELAGEIRARFRARAMALRKSIAEENVPLLGLAVIEISGEYFGIELNTVQEFCNISQLSPIPCCPPHILGAMSLRGKLLTLIDPRRALNLASSPQCRKALVVRVSAAPASGVDDQLIGVAVDDVRDVVYLHSESLHPPPSALIEQCEAETIGTASYDGKTMTVLNLPALLARPEWIVDENV